MHCEICGRPYAECHHLFTRGAHGARAEHPANIIYLCRQHHMSAHNLGRWTFAGIHGLERRYHEAERAVKGGNGCYQGIPQ
jgi:hypothetical protein